MCSDCNDWSNWSIGSFAWNLFALGLPVATLLSAVALVRKATRKGRHRHNWIGQAVVIAFLLWLVAVGPLLLFLGLFEADAIVSILGGGVALFTGWLAIMVWREEY